MAIPQLLAAHSTASPWVSAVFILLAVGVMALRFSARGRAAARPALGGGRGPFGGGRGPFGGGRGPFGGGGTNGWGGGQSGSTGVGGSTGETNSPSDL